MQNISQDELVRRLSFGNPWWKSEDLGETVSPVLPHRAFLPAFYRQLKDHKTGRVLELAGPPCVGKTTMLRGVVADLLDKGVAGYEILYCDLAAPSLAFSTPAQLVGTVAEKFGHSPDTELYLFFDDAQYLDGWRKKIQEVAARWPQAHVVVAVSCSSGSSPEENWQTFVLPPLTFAEYLRFRKIDQMMPGSADSENGGKSNQAMTISPSAIPALNEAFCAYVNFGGFPKAGTGENDADFVRDGIAGRVLHRDISGRNKIGDPKDLDRLFAVLARNTGTEVTIEELTGVVGVAKNTLRKYLDFLEQAFLIRRLPRLDRDGKRFQRAFAFKVYLTAPCVYAALFGPVALDDKMFPRLAETALVSQWLGSGANRYLAYASWRGGQIDLLEINPNTDQPDNVYEMDWYDGYASPGPKADKGPGELTAFVARTNRDARTHILTASTARRGAMAGIDITLAPLALYTYWIGRTPTGDS